MQSEERLHALDAVRAFALLCGIILHVTMSFWPRFKELGFPIVDRSPSWTAAYIFFVIHLFRVTMFFMIAGFFARLAVQRKGIKAFIQDRAKRIAVPLIVGWVICGTLITLTLVWALLKTNGAHLSAAPPTSTQSRSSIQLTHLWFLYYLLWMYIIVLTIRTALRRLVQGDSLHRFADRMVDVAVRTHIAPIMLAAPVCLALYLLKQWVTWMGVPTPDHSLIPEWPSLIGFGTAFLFGWLLQRQPKLLRVWEQRWPAYLVVAIALTMVSLNLTDTTNMFSAALAGATKMAYAICYALATWAWTFAIIGMGMAFCSGQSTVRRYVADSSYWLYIAHMPLVLALQVVVMQWPVHWALKFSIILVVSFTLLFLSYQLFVRSTFIGEVLNGRKYPRVPLRAVFRVASAQMVVPVTREMSSGMQGNPESNDCLASLRNVGKTFGTIHALNGFDLDIRRGELLAVLGPNGAGKSTAISLLLGLQVPDQGDAQLFGQSPQSYEVRRRIGVMMQEVALPQELKVRELITVVSSYYPNPYCVDEVLTLTRTAPLAMRRYGKLSGGEKRQVQFALAVCGRPQLLFLDEPTVGLDIQAREMMWTTIRELIQRGTSIVLTTHYLEEAEALADRVIVVAKGKVIAAGSVDEMRALVSRRRISCISGLSTDAVGMWIGVDAVKRDMGRLHITASNAENVVRQLLATDQRLRELEVRRAGLSEAFIELTRETA